MFELLSLFLFLINILGTNIESLEEAFNEAKNISNQNTENPGAIILLTDVDAAGTLFFTKFLLNNSNRIISV